MRLTTSAADFSKETLVVKEEETYDAGVFERVEAEVVKLFKEPSLYVIQLYGKEQKRDDKNYVINVFIFHVSPDVTEAVQVFFFTPTRLSPAVCWKYLRSLEIFH